jgi:putative membrane protein
MAGTKPGHDGKGAPQMAGFCLGIERACRVRRRRDRATFAAGRLEGDANMILQSLAGLPAFLVYFCTAIIAVVAYLFVYTRVTPHDEFQLIRDNDPAAAIALGLSLLGFVLPVVSAIAHSADVVDCLVWSAIALIVQIAVYFIVKIPVPNLSARIAAGELAAAIWLGLASLAAGALNAASMIY